MHTLPKLPYSYDALEPHIDKVTMEIHHTKHHQAYIDNLNKAIENHSSLANLSVEKLLLKIDTVPSDIQQAVINHGGGHANHTFFWKIMSPKKTSPGEMTLKVLKEKFWSIDVFKEEFTKKAMGVFGSGWAFLISTSKGLVLKRHSFQNSPLLHNNSPILGIDVWEHAYYLKYQNRRAEYVKAWWNVVNWDEVERNLVKALS